jgi:2-oxoisovalerate dehydrogenase E1 component
LPYSTSIEPDENYLLPFGKGKTVKQGADLTIVTYGMGVRDSLNAVKKFEKNSNKTIEIIDLRTIAPWDRELVLESVKKTSRALIVHEDTMTTGFGAEISAVISREAFRWLDAPVSRVAAKDSHIPYNPIYESDVLPNENKVLEGIEEVMGF